MFTFTLMRNGFRRAAPFALIVAFGLAACGGGYSGSGSGYGMSTGGGPGSKLFGADSAHMAIGSLANPNPPAGMIPVDRIISGMYYTQLSNKIGSLALDPALDYLYVGNGTSILVFYGASMANGDISPTRVISGIGNTGSLFLDTVNNRLYVGDVNGVKVFNGASMANGAPAPNRTITGDFGASFQIFGVAVDTTPTNDILYVSNKNVTASSYQISVFTSASTVSGSNTPNRTITPTVSNVNLPVAGISLDTANNRLYVAGAPSPTVMVFDNASANNTNGQIAPTKTLIGFPSGILNVVVDTVNDRLYAVGVSGVYIVNSVSTATGMVPATAILPVAGGNLTAVAVNPM